VVDHAHCRDRVRRRVHGVEQRPLDDGSERIQHRVECVAIDDNDGRLPQCHRRELGDGRGEAQPVRCVVRERHFAKRNHRQRKCETEQRTRAHEIIQQRDVEDRARSSHTRPPPPPVFFLRCGRDESIARD